MDFWYLARAPGPPNFLGSFLLGSATNRDLSNCTRISLISCLDCSSTYLWLLTSRSTLMSSPSRRSRISLCSLTGPCWSLTRGGTSPRSLEAREHAPDTRSPTVKSRWQNLSQCCYIPLCLLWLLVKSMPMLLHPPLS